MSTVCVIKSRKYPLSEKGIVDGGTLNAHVIVSELRQHGCNVEVFTRNEGNEKTVVNQTGVRIFRVPFTRYTKQNVLQRDYEEGQSFLEGVISHSEFRPEKYTCIHTHHWTSGIGLESHIPSQMKLIHTPHLLAAEKARYNKIWLPSNVKAAEQALLDRANHIIALSKDEATALHTTYDCTKQKIVVAPNGISDAFFEVSPLDVNGYHPHPILLIGRSCRQKGIDILLDAVEQIVESGVSASVRLVGGPYGEPEFDKCLQERIRKKPLTDIVEQVGEVAHQNIPSLLSESFVYTQPSRYESQGIALLEAMAAGRIVVASNLPAIREYIEHGKNGFLVDPKNAHALADTLRAILLNPERALPLASAARSKAQSYTWQHMLQTVLPLFLNK